MLFLLQVKNKFIVQGIDQGLYWFDGHNFTFIDGSEAFGKMKVHSIIGGNKDDLLICTASHGIYLFNGKEFKYWETPASTFLKEYTCNAGICISIPCMYWAAS
jgi:hypothetical protein